MKIYMYDVTIIIPVYNSEQTIQRCLDSCVNQTMKNIEIICINDGSRDNSLKILEYYSKKNNNIVIVNQKNKGTGFSRNIGIIMAKGKYVCFLDSDDYYPNDEIIEKMFYNVQINKVPICGGSAMYVRNGKTMDRDENVQRKQTYFSKSGIMFYKDYQGFIGFWRFIYEKKMLIDNNIYFPESSEYEDPVFFVKAMLCAQKFYAMIDNTYCVTIGHHMREYNNDIKIIETLNGINSVIKMATANNLVILHNNILQDILFVKYNILMYAKESKNKDIQDLLYLFLDSIILDWLPVDNQIDIKKLFTADGISRQIDDARKEFDNFNDIVKKNTEIWIYGAGVATKKIIQYIKNNFKNSNVKKIVVSNKIGNPECISNIKVEQLSDVPVDKQILMLVMIMGKVGENMVEELKKIGFDNVYWCDYSKMRIWI